MEIKDTWTYVASFLLAAGGYLLPFWPLSLLGILLAVVRGKWIFAVVLALLVDLMWGPVFGLVSVVYVPFTVFAVVASALRYFLAQNLLSKSPPERL